MDVVSLLFYRSWLDAVRGEAPPAAGNRVAAEGRIYRVVDGSGPDWRRVLAPLAVIGILVLAGAFFPAGA
jgi:hypothetical protein